jgi:hypothetical protein
VRWQEQRAEQSKEDCKPVKRYRDSSHPVFVAHAHKHAACKLHFLTKCSDCLWSTDEKVYQAANEVETEDNNHPDEFLDAVESFVGDGVYEHPNPKNARRNSESSN